ncbi:hypothetical protein BOTNAR_0046g00060 [Botryotinia narcissicola]|uniref:Uncharacterized protein n=1 Tax=Botryotinia narcissicola TaxID=278944 RepID=A0A4Z1J214_9HELO|nr:hypothetical protein BOTNAR_0046g00060 [Botryotinia narcissicola]
MSDMISMSPEFDAELIPSVTETKYNNIYYGRDPLQQAMVPQPLPAVVTPATLRSQIEPAFQSLPKHAAVCSLKDYIAPPIPPHTFDQACHRGFPDLAIEELQRDLVPFDGHYDWRFRWPDILANYLYHRIRFGRETSLNLKRIAKENPYEVPEDCRALVIAEGRKRGEIPDSGYYQPANQASGSGYPEYPTTYDDGSTSGYGAGHYGQSIYRPSSSGNVSYTRDPPAVNDTSGTNNYQPSGFNQYPYPSGGSGYNQFAAGGQLYDHGNEKADGSYIGVNTSEPNIITAEPQHQERIPAPRDSTASGSRSSRKGKGRNHR